MIPAYCFHHPLIANHNRNVFDIRGKINKPVASDGFMPVSISMLSRTSCVILLLSFIAHSGVFPVEGGGREEVKHSILRDIALFIIKDPGRFNPGSYVQNFKNLDE